MFSSGYELLENASLVALAWGPKSVRFSCSTKIGIFLVDTSAFISYERNDDERQETERAKRIKVYSLSDTYSQKLLISDFYYFKNCHFSKIKYEYQSRKYLSYNGEPRVLIAPSFCLRVLCKFTLDSYIPKLVCVGDLTFLTLFFTTIVSF